MTAGLQVICSNRLEALQRRLSGHLRAEPLSSVFTAELVLVPSMAVARWLQVRLAGQQGVAANYRFMLPAQALWSLADPTAGGEDPLSREAAAWRLFGCLGAKENPLPPELANLLAADVDGLKRWHLARRIADTFDRYQFYRPEMIARWSQAGSGDWQQRLWCELVRDFPDGHRVARMRALLQRLGGGQPPDLLPERISVFAVSSLPPLFVALLRALSEWIPVRLYLLSPSDQYWADLHSRRSLARLRLERPDAAAYLETGEELLASWGRRGQAMLDLLLGDEAAAAGMEDAHEPPAADSLLHWIQRRIFDLDEALPPPAPDGSLEIAVCHSAWRECQVLHDRLLDLLQTDPGLRPEDVLVLVPDLAAYAPQIEAVFRRDTGPGIAWNLSDTSLADEHPLVDAFLRLLGLPASRLPASEVLAYLDLAPLARRFQLNAEDVEQLRELTLAARVRWGLDAGHRAELDLPALEDSTWQQALDRVFAGYACGEDLSWQGLETLGAADTASLRAAGRLAELLAALARWRRALAAPRSALAWQEDLNRLLTEFFGEDDPDDRLQQIRDALDELRELAGQQQLSLNLVRHWLSTELGRRAAHGRHFSGGVTFCAMRSLGSLPFRVICLLGMNDASFPRRDAPEGFDLMAGNWRPGDPGPGEEDRYLMLETLLCARDKLYISYTGRSQKDNSECQPSVLVRELLDVVETACSQAHGRAAVANRLVRVHPMQPFSPRNFAPLAAGGGHDEFWCEVANALVRPRPAKARDWPRQAMARTTQEPVTLELETLRRFYRDPVRYFYQARLGIQLEEELAPADEEPFELDGLARWQIRQLMIEGALRGAPPDLTSLRGRGLLPLGAPGQRAYAQVREETASLVRQFSAYAGVPPAPRFIDLELPGQGRLTGQVGGWWSDLGLLHATPSKFGPRPLLSIWLDHLAISAAGAGPSPADSLLICSDMRHGFAPLPPAPALEELARLSALCREGFTRPLPVFPKVSFELWDAGQGRKTTSAAAKAWEGDDQRAGVKAEPYVSLALAGRDFDPAADAETLRLARAIYAPAMTQARRL